MTLWKRRKYLLIAGGGALLTGIAAGTWALYGVYKFHHSQILPPTVHDVDGNFVYITRDSEDLIEDISKEIPVRLDQYVPRLNLSNFFDSAMNAKQRAEKIEELTRRKWTDADAYIIAQKAFSDPSAMLAIARSDSYDPRLLFRGARLKPDFTKESIREEFVRILKDCTPKVKKLSDVKNQALKYAQRKPVRVWNVGIVDSPSDVDVIKYAIQCLSEISEDQSACKQMRKEGIIPVLIRLQSEFDVVSLDLSRWISRILANVTAYAQDERMLDEICRSNILPALAKWSRSPDLDLALRASKALANLDEGRNHCVYPSGIYLLYPLRKYQIPPEFDVIFVHGLRGSVLKTWRQNLKTIKEMKKNDVPVDEPYFNTQCWPKDWLAQDCPTSRIIGVEYPTSFVTETFSPLNIEEVPSPETLRVTERRSLDLLDRLKQAGVGERPIVWISHSMGGLLVKQMLLLAEKREQFRNILTNTLACVFYSTPHLGSPVAEGFAKYLPVSSEVQDLRINNPYLLKLQELFVELVQRNKISLLSFGETLPDYRIISTRFVPVESANPNLGRFIRLDNSTHFYSCKPEHHNSAIYSELIQFLRDVIDKHQSQTNEVH